LIDAERRLPTNAKILIATIRQFPSVVGVHPRTGQPDYGPFYSGSVKVQE
jgi:hypothetical protein